MEEQWDPVEMNFSNKNFSLRKRASSLQNTLKLEAGKRASRARTSSSIPLVEEDDDSPQSRVYRAALWKYTKRILPAVLLILLVCELLRVYRTQEPCKVLDMAKTQLATVSDRNNFRPVVPKIIHQQWKNKTIPTKFKQWQQKWQKIFPEPEYKYMLWTDASGKKLIEDHYPFFLKTYNEYPFGIQRADSMRYFILHRYGGVYADLDYEPLENFWEYIPKDKVGLVESPYLYAEIVQNSFMSSPKEDPFWLNVFDALEQFKAEPVFYSTGPSLLAHSFSANKEPFYKLPCETFYRIPHFEFDRSPFWGVLQRETIGRFYPMKYCGDFNEPQCQLGKHHCSASYIQDTGVLALLWT